MASLAFDEWILTAIRSKKITLKKFTWIESFDYSFYDYQAEFFYKDTYIAGRGTDVNEDLAIKKSIAELFERFMVKSHKIHNSNGCAAHMTYDEACSAAKNELIERDAYLFQFLNKSLPAGENFESSFRVSVEKWLQKNIPTAALNCVQIVNSEDVFVFKSYVRLKSNGLIIGLGTDSNFSKALDKSIVEVLRQLAFYTKNNFDAQTYKELFNKPFKEWTFADHGDLALCEQYIQDLVKEFSSSKHHDNLNYHQLQFSYQTYELPNGSVFEEIPLVFVKATCSETIPLICGEYTKDHLKNLRIEKALDLWNRPCLHLLR